MLEMSVRAFRITRGVEVVVAVPADYVADVESALSVSSVALVNLCRGRRWYRRQDSVANAFARVSAKTDVVLIHDAAPFVTAALIDRMIRAGQPGAAVMTMPVSDRERRRRAPMASAADSRHPAAEEIFLAQTPQAFRRDTVALHDNGTADRPTRPRSPSAPAFCTLSETIRKHQDHDARVEAQPVEGGASR